MGSRSNRDPKWIVRDLLTPDTRQQKMMLLVGPKRSGKGTIGRVLKALHGEDSVAAPTLASLGTNFGLWPLIGRIAASVIIGDARLGGRSDIAQIVERLLSITVDGVVHRIEHARQTRRRAALAGRRAVHME
jgi:hypothetical protein